MNNIPTIITNNKKHLQELIQYEIDNNGEKCSLNHIDVSNVTDMNYLFYKSMFNGDISQWNTSNVTSMSGMFFGSEFNGDVLNWNTSNVIDMTHMFHSSKFNEDLSDWPINNIIQIEYMSNMLSGCPSPKPWWYIQDNDKRNEAIKIYRSKKDLMDKLDNQLTPSKKIKKLKI